MRCLHAQRLMRDVRTDTLSAAARGRLETHLAACPTCAAESRTMHRLDTLLDRLPQDVAIPPAFAAATLDRVRRLAAEDPSARAFGVPTWARLSLPLAVGALAVGLVVLRSESPPLAPPVTAARRTVAPAPAPARIATARATPPVAQNLPPKLLADVDLFVDLPVLRNLEKLQHFDAIATTGASGDSPASDAPHGDG